MESILECIIKQKKKEVKNLIFLDKIPKNIKNISKLTKNKPFYISEYKRKSPSNQNIGLKISLEEHIYQYINSNTQAISILTDYLFFGGSYQDLYRTSKIVKNTNILILQKDFIIDEKQIQHARINGADLILLIARILDPIRLIELKKYINLLGMGAILEIHNIKEYKPFKNEKFDFIGINNRNLETFNVSLNRFNVLAQQLPKNTNIIAESGITNPIDLAVLKKQAHGFLIGTSNMLKKTNESCNSYYKYNKKYFLKCCGLRKLKNIQLINSDLIGVNFSHISKRKIQENIIKADKKLVAVFKKNSFSEIQKIIMKFHFQYIQIYAKELTLSEIKKINSKKIFAFNPNNSEELNEALNVAKFIDFFILDSSSPGSGKIIDLKKCKSFPYPFLLAGGININNLTRILKLKFCIGVDLASGIETENDIDPKKVNKIIEVLNSF